jgi:hypothetical protein
MSSNGVPAGKIRSSKKIMLGNALDHGIKQQHTQVHGAIAHSDRLVWRLCVAFVRDSHQQSVTASPSADDQACLFLVKEAHGALPWLVVNTCTRNMA